jgi:peptide deformylase
MSSIAEAQKRAAVKRATDARKEAEEGLRDFVGKRLPDAAKGGKVLPLKLYPDDSLQMVCDPVEDFDSDLDEIISSMATTMYMTGGVGLAANQVGIPLRVFVCDVRHSKQQGKDGFRVFVNPVVLTASDELVRMREGCLSFPGVLEHVERPEDILIRAMTPRGKPFEANLRGWEARVFLHEFDHLEGITFVDYMGNLQKRQVVNKMKKIKRQIVLDDRAATKRKKQRNRRR